MAEAESGAFPTKPFFTDTYDSYCHAWGAYVSYLLSRYVLGVECAEPGFRRVRVAPRPCGLRAFSGSVVTPRGCVRVDCEVAGRTLRAVLRIPEGTTWEFSAPASVRTAHLRVNDTDQGTCSGGEALTAAP